MEHQLELLYVEAMKNMVDLINTDRFSSAYEAKRQGILKDVENIKNFKLGQAEAEKQQTLILTQNKEMLESFCQEIRELFFGNVREFNEKYSTNVREDISSVCNGYFNSISNKNK